MVNSKILIDLGWYKHFPAKLFCPFGHLACFAKSKICFTLNSVMNIILEHSH